MKPLTWALALAFSCAMLLISIQYLRNEYVNATRVSVNADMDQIRRAAETYARTNGAYPATIQEIPSALLPGQVVHRPARYSLMGSSVLVPASPYSLRKVTNGIEIVCKFYGKMRMDIVMEPDGDLRLETYEPGRQ
jgi:hypothetical protein